MIEEGATAPSFTLPAVVDDEFDRVDFEDHVGQEVLVLVFYPGDFNPACDGEGTDLDVLDLFSMQKDVAIFGIAADSVFSHRAFAETFDLHTPLLADTHAEVAAAYGVDIDDPTAGYRNRRAVVVVDLDGVVTYTWETDDLSEVPEVDPVRTAVEGVSGADTAAARYRVGHAHYQEGRRAFASGMEGLRNGEWMIAQGDFDRAEAQFEEAAAEFDSAARFAEQPQGEAWYERANEKATTFRQASEWLASGANAHATGDTPAGEGFRADAEEALESAREIGDPIDPTDVPPTEYPPDHDDAVEEIEGFTFGSDRHPAGEGADAEDGVEVDADATGTAADSAEADDDVAGDEGEIDDVVDDAELEEITAELEEQTEQAQAEQPAPDTRPEPEPTAADEDASETSDAAPVDEHLSADDEVELDLADPMEDEDEADADDGEDDEHEADRAGNEEDVGSGGQGVPDSL